MTWFNATCLRRLPIVLLPIALLIFSIGQIPARSQASGSSEATSESTTESSSSSSIRPTLTLGSEGESVAELQAMLKLMGFYSGDVDGVYRATTAAAVSAFQQAVGLQADGIAGPNTWNRLLPPSPPVNATTAATVPEPTTPTFPAPAPVPTPSPAPAPVPTPEPSLPTPDISTPTDEQSAAVDVDLPVLRFGMRGPAVARLQDRLTTLGFFTGVIDGIFGPETLAAVQLAQRNYDLDPDGVVGPATWTVLLQQ